MKRVCFGLTGALLLFTVPLAQASKPPQVIHYLSCQELSAPMFDAVVVNVDQYYNPIYKTRQLMASVYHRVEQGTILVSRTAVTERQARHPKAPKEFKGKGIYLEVQTSTPPTKKGFPGRLELRLQNLQTQMETNCQFVE